MKKDNEDIHLHIINEDYKTIKNKRNHHFDVSGKAISLIELKNSAAVAEQLRKMHNDFAGTNEELLNKAKTSNQLEKQSSLPINSLDVSELFESYQIIKTEDQSLIDNKQELLTMEHSLRNRLTQEICKKKKSIEELQVEILALQNSCKEIKQELSLPTNN
jgi:hypothetical protein